MINNLENEGAGFLYMMTGKEVSDSSGLCPACGREGIGHYKRNGEIDLTKMRCRYCHRTFRVEFTE